MKLVAKFTWLYNVYGLIVKQNKDTKRNQQVCKSCGEVEPKLLELYTIPYHSYIKHVCRCGNCGRYINVIEKRVKENAENVEKVDEG